MAVGLAWSYFREKVDACDRYLGVGCIGLGSESWYENILFSCVTLHDVHLQ